VKQINHPQDVLEKGQEVEVVVLAVDSENRKINLGLKQLASNPWPPTVKRNFKRDKYKGRFAS